ncbi:YhcN/YlaJ family sporulation lipoprotein [Bacillus sp. V3B]|uniref:YhcN/YlaJ family sporulation lipoprotein n=1 Tax=Bacillus sp. V3B TaxID=2804915 RepID=UPI0021091BB2|nr:YhcN/YlaJ family sporulation lipoprotein [Bacillus sp. V3B]MCQ6276183.1 YhcN/YlaJ family sporulation lipoprotein [Bacillus sp. V3B]
MKWRALLTAASLSSLLLGACGTNNDMDDTALRNQDNPELRNVGYNTNDNMGLNNNTYGTVNNANNYNATTNLNDRTNTMHNINNNNENRNRIDVADKAADKIVEMREVDRANVIVTDNNAYVAAKLADNASKKLSKDVEKKISDLVKSTNRDIDHVYVSINPDFYNRTTSYANDIRDGRPIDGFFNEFGELVRRVFPTER